MYRIIFIFFCLIMLSNCYSQSAEFNFSFNEGLYIEKTINLYNDSATTFNEYLIHKDLLLIKVSSNESMDFFVLINNEKVKQLKKNKNARIYNELYVLDKGKSVFYSLNFNLSASFLIRKVNRDKYVINTKTKIEDLESILKYSNNFEPLRAIQFSGNFTYIDNASPSNHTLFFLHDFTIKKNHIFNDIEKQEGDKLNFKSIDKILNSNYNFSDEIIDYQNYNLILSR